MEKTNVLPGIFIAVFVTDDRRYIVTKAWAAGKGVQIPFLSYSTQRTQFLFLLCSFPNYTETLVSTDCHDVFDLSLQFLLGVHKSICSSKLEDSTLETCCLFSIFNCFAPEFLNVTKQNQDLATRMHCIMPAI